MVNTYNVYCIALVKNESNERSNRQMHLIDRMFNVICCVFVIGTAQVIACFCFFSLHFSKHFHLGIKHWKRLKRDNNILLWYFTMSSGLRTLFRSVQFSSVRLMCSVFYFSFHTHIFSWAYCRWFTFHWIMGASKQFRCQVCVCIWTFGVRCSVKWKFMISKNLEINNVIIKWINDYNQSVFLLGFSCHLAAMHFYMISFLYFFLLIRFVWVAVRIHYVFECGMHRAVCIDFGWHFIPFCRRHLVAAFLLITHWNDDDIEIIVFSYTIHSHIMAQFDVSQKPTWTHGHIMINGNNFESTN